MHECPEGRRGWGKGEGISRRLPAEHRAHCGAWSYNPEIMPWGEIKSWFLNLLNHPGTSNCCSNVTICIINKSHQEVLRGWLSETGFGILITIDNKFSLGWNAFRDPKGLLKHQWFVGCLACSVNRACDSCSWVVSSSSTLCVEIT